MHKKLLFTDLILGMFHKGFIKCKKNSYLKTKSYFNQNNADGKEGSYVWEESTDLRKSNIIKGTWKGS